MILCITEKHDVARNIAGILGAGVRRDGFYEGNGYRVTWTIGHLCCLLEPHDYTPAWKRWSLGALPMIPKRFDVKIIDDAGIRRQFAVIEKLIAEADEIINCGDAGQEGELIQRWVMKKAGAKCPVRRLWISSLTDEAIREGFENLAPQANYDRLFYAGLSRAIGDWILGMNATRLYTLKYSEPGTVLSIGRVQTPTLALIVRRQQEIESFVPHDSWELRTTYRNVTFTSTAERFDKEDEASETAGRIASEPFSVTDVTKKKGHEAPPRLFDLTSLQVECNRRFSWTADQTLRLIQSLYEKKLTTYPRVDTTYLPDDIYPKIGPTLKAMAPYAAYTAPILAAKIPKTKKVFDNSKVTDHHAIIPTGQSPVGIDGDEKRLYHLVAMRFIAAFYPDCEFMATSVTGRAADIEFRVNGKVITKQGWKSLFASSPAAGDDKAAGDDETEQALPEFTVGESGPHTPSIAKKTSQPPKYYTEGSLLRAMETAGRSIDDEDLREAMKDNGIGRPSTRAAIIETLFKRRYIRRERKNLVATQAGIDLIATIDEELLKSAKLTGLWENKLRRIERGDFSPSQFVREISEMVQKIVVNVLSDNTRRRIGEAPEPDKTNDSGTNKNTGKQKKPRAKAIRSLEQIACPLCGKGHLLRGRAAYGCSEYASGCSFRLPFDQYPAELTPAQLNKKLKSTLSKSAQ